MAEKKPYYLLLGLLCVSGSALAEIVTSIGTKIAYDDNIYRLESNEYDAWVTRVAPGFKAIAEQGANTYEINAGAESGIYSSSALGSDDYTDYRLNGIAKLEFDVRNRISFSLNHKKGHDDRGTGRMDTGAKTSVANVLISNGPDVWQKDGGEIKYGYGVPDGWGEVAVLAGYEKLNYTNNTPSTNGLDLHKNIVGLQGNFRISPAVTLLADITNRQYRYDVSTPNKDSDERRYLVGAQWNVSEALKGTAKYGLQQRDADNPNTKDFSSGAWDADVIWAPKKYSTLKVTAFRGVEDSKNSPSLIDVELYTTRWSHGWSERLRSEVFYEYRTENYDSINRDDVLYKWGFSTQYKAAPWLKMSGEYRYEDREVSAAAGQLLDYERNVLTFGAEVELK